jgi:hypothetical protein
MMAFALSMAVAGVLLPPDDEPTPAAGLEEPGHF